MNFFYSCILLLAFTAPRATAQINNPYARFVPQMDSIYRFISTARTDQDGTRSKLIGASSGMYTSTHLAARQFVNATEEFYYWHPDRRRWTYRAVFSSFGPGEQEPLKQQETELKDQLMQWLKHRHAEYMPFVTQVSDTRTLFFYIDEQKKMQVYLTSTYDPDSKITVVELRVDPR